MYSTQVLPLAGAHFRAGGGRARRRVGEEGDEEVVGFHGEEAAEFVEPEGFVDAGRRSGEGLCGLASDWGDCVVWSAGMGVVKSFEVFLQLER
jgi:hypothetical protein